MKTVETNEVFSDKLENWLKGSERKTIRSLSEVFAEKSFAVVVLLLMIVPALPLPTGGVTHVFEVITAILALECIAGMKNIWIPDRWKNLRVAPSVGNKAVPMILKKIRWFEKRSSPHWRHIFQMPVATRIIWLIILAFTVLAFVAPPFSGLDTLPAMGVVLICLSIVLEDAVILLVGTVIGVLGGVLTIGLGTIIVDFMRRLF